MQSEQLIQSLIEQTRQIINRVEALKSYDLETLTWRAQEDAWSILECIEHLNRYGDDYLPSIERAIKASNTQAEQTFKSGFLGGYFAKSMLPKEKLNKMKTFNDKNPLHASLDRSVIDTFMHQQTQLLDLLNQSRTVSLNKVKIPTTFSSLIKMKLGDLFQFLVNHMLRHLAQIDRVKAMGLSSVG
ncbi:MAG: DinB family protein [Bacteroidota bacterium]